MPLNNFEPWPVCSVVAGSIPNLGHILGWQVQSPVVGTHTQATNRCVSLTDVSSQQNEKMLRKIAVLPFILHIRIKGKGIKGYIKPIIGSGGSGKQRG